MTNEEQIEELLKKRSIPWVQIMKMGGHPRKIMKEAQKNGDWRLAAKAFTAWQHHKTHPSLPEWSGS